MNWQQGRSAMSKADDQRSVCSWGAVTKSLSNAERNCSWLRLEREAAGESCVNEERQEQRHSEGNAAGLQETGGTHLTVEGWSGEESGLQGVVRVESKHNIGTNQGAYTSSKRS